MRTNIEDKILDILFKEAIIPTEMADKLLPSVSFNQEHREDMDVQDGYNLARKDLSTSIKRMLQK